jgi:uncharacterized protein YfdQ (DUF2303 family)
MEDLSEFSSGIAAAIEAGRALAGPQVNPDPHGTAFVVVPTGHTVEHLPERGRPAHPAGTVKLRDVASFVRYWKDHSDANSRVYASLDPARFVAVLDDHSAALPLADSANWRGFRASFDVPLSREWRLWLASDRKPMQQLAFAEFLQDNLPDVIVPPGAELLEMALNFETAQAATFISAQRLQDGSQTLHWKTDNSSATVKLPERLVLSIPVFENDKPNELRARLRYRAKDGALVFWYELERPHKVLEAAFREAWRRIETDGGAVVLLGSPE